MRTRAFKQLSRNTQLYILLSALNRAIEEFSTHDSKWRERRNIYSIAVQHAGSSAGVRKEDFNMIKGMTIEEITCAILPPA